MEANIRSIKGGSGTAQKAHVLAPYTFTNNDGVEYTGEMVNQGAKSTSLNCGGSYTIPAGYHNGSGKITANSLKSQTSADAVAANITKGKTAWVNGVKVTGTRPAPVTTQSGTFSGSIGNITTKEFTVNFSSQFDTIPTVKVTVTRCWHANGDASTADCNPTNVTVTRGYFTVRLTNVHPATLNVNASWSATG